MKVLIAGGGGFIGSHLADSLLEDGHNVTVVDNFCSGQRSNLDNAQNHDSFTLIEQDILEPMDFHKSFDHVLHLASRASPPDYQDHPIHTMRTNSEGTLQLVHLADEMNASFLYASTSEVYGDPENHPQDESYNGNVNPIGPRACYDEAKRYGEALITSYARENNLDWNMIRIFNTYGPRLREDDGRVISNFVSQALNDEPLTVYGDGSQTRSFCYIDDLIRGIRKVMDYDDNDVFNLGNPDETTILELAKTVQDVIDTESEIIFEDLPEDDPSQRKPDMEKTRTILDFQAKTSLKTGLRKTIEGGIS